MIIYSTARPTRSLLNDWRADDVRCNRPSTRTLNQSSDASVQLSLNFSD